MCQTCWLYSILGNSLACVLTNMPFRAKVYPYSFNFVIYYRFSTPFRYTFRQYFLALARKSTKFSPSSYSAVTTKASTDQIGAENDKLLRNNGKVSLVIVLNNCDDVDSRGVLDYRLPSCADDTAEFADTKQLSSYHTVSDTDGFDIQNDPARASL